MKTQKTKCKTYTCQAVFTITPETYILVCQFSASSESGKLLSQLFTLAEPGLAIPLVLGLKLPLAPDHTLPLVPGLAMPPAVGLSLPLKGGN